MERNDPILRATLIFQTIFKRTTPVNLELKEENFWRKKLLNFKGYISGGQQNPKFWRSFKASEFNGNAAIYP